VNYGQRVVMRDTTDLSGDPSFFKPSVPSANAMTSSKTLVMGANAQASSISLVASGPPEQCKSQQAASRGSNPG
jgi:hypothetical protein